MQYFETKALFTLGKIGQIQKLRFHFKLLLQCFATNEDFVKPAQSC